MSKYEAGRALDALVAERVMGSRVEQIRPEIPERGWPALRGARHNPGGWSSSVASLTADGRSATTYYEPPHYSTEISAAWEVVEKLGAHPGPRFRTLHMVVYPYRRTYATFDYDRAESGDDWAEGNGEHATPLAICRAALEAVGATP